ncbi:MAG: hypothetical protein JRN20_19485 [Nitrososphaerota archaeon]|nr:hypothetical protein [Nitrososphaerota archaeon]
MVEFRKNNIQSWDEVAKDDTFQPEEYETTADSTFIKQSAPYGEVAPPKSGISKIVGEKSGDIGNARYWLIRGTFSSETETRIYKQVERTVRHLKVTDSDRHQLQERIKKKLPKIQDETGLSLKKSIAGLIFSETRELGVPVDEIQRCLANSGFDLKTKRLSFIVRRTNKCEQHACSFVPDNILQNGQRPRYEPVVEQIASGYYEVFLIPMFDEVLGRDVKISLSCDCTICSFDGADIGTDAKSATLRVNTKKSSFAAFHMASRTLAANVRFPEDEKERQDRKEKKILAIFSPSSNNHPLTRALATRSCCLAQLQSEFLRCYRELTENGTKGISPRSLARKAVFEADARVYARMSRERKLVAWELLIPSLPYLSAGDRRYVLVMGICVPSEFS